MGQKVSPIGMRVGVIRDWESRWYAEKDYGTLLMEDVKIREFLFKELHAAYVSRIEIERSKNRVEIIIRAARPGVIIGKQIHIKVVEVANPDLDAHLVARAIAEQLEQRASFRTCQKRQIQKTMRAGAKGIRTLVSGRLGGADIARSEGYSEGVVPLHTLRSDIDFAIVEAMTTYGKLGVKVWICRGEVLPGQMVQEPEAPKMPQGRDRRRGGRNDRRGNRNNNNNSRNAEAKAAAPKAEGTVEGGK